MNGRRKEWFEEPLTVEEDRARNEEPHVRVRARRAYPEGRCWIGTTTESPPKWEVSNGPVGQRGESCEWDSPREAIDHARRLGLQVVFEEDFRWE